MNRPVTFAVALLLAAAVGLLPCGAASAQSSGSTGSSYPYWSSAPQSYRGSNLTIPVPGASPNTISNAARSSAFGAERSLDRGVGLGGGFMPPFVSANDTSLSLLRNLQTASDNRAHIWLRVPETAEVWVNGVKTRQSGESRYYYSPPLTPGRQYAYQMRIVWKKDGKPVEEKEQFLVSAGASLHRDFPNPVHDTKKSAYSSPSSVQK